MINEEAKLLKKLVLLILPLCLIAGYCIAQEETKGEEMTPEKNPIVKIQTNQGSIYLEVFLIETPIHAQNFLTKVKEGKYDSLTFHRIVPGFVIQGGDPDGSGEGGPGYTIQAEFNTNKHVVGAIASARRPDNVNPAKRSSGSFDFAGNTYNLYVDRVYLEVVDGRFEIDMLFPENAPQGIRRGMSLHIRLEMGDISDDAILLAKGGFFQTTGGNWVYVLDRSEKIATKKPIRLGMSNAYVHEVLEGLQPGEKVITSSYESFGNHERLVLR